MIGRAGVVLLLTLSVVAVIASLHAWRERQTYGLFRFCGFETLALLVAWNADRWFDDPLSMHQLLSWTILAAATLLAAYGFHLLRTVGRAQRRIMEDTRQIVEIGAYRFVRHPLYGSLILFVWGVFLKGIDMVSAGLALLATLSWFVTARYEEKFNIERFGAPYTGYIKRTKMFVPFLL
jgi:protein-S-isoprenylcysteine O-methyltransferase Ste14